MGLTKRSSTAVKLQAPKRVIRATQGYTAHESVELSFKKEDFFYVLSTPHEYDEWYEVTNPLSGERGMVPAAFFEVLESRQDRINRINRSASNASATGAPLPGSAGQLGIPRSVPANTALYGMQTPETGSLRRPSGGNAAGPLPEAMTLRARTTSIQHQHYAQHQRRPSQPFGGLGSAAGATAGAAPSTIELHGTALYGFNAANNNELTVIEGDELLVVAQSTGDWLIARPTVGGARAGLVPAAYIEVRDHLTGALVDDLPAFLARHQLRLRTALEWERHQRDIWAARSTHSSASVRSDLSAAAAAHYGRTTSPAYSAYDEDQAATPRSSIGASMQPSRGRALTTSSSTSSIAERSSYRQPHKSRQVSGSSLQHIVGENYPRFRADEVDSVSVPSFICKDGAYLFQVSLRFTSGDQRNIYRGYDDVICCRNQLNESFPRETSPLKLARLSMHSSSMLYLNDAIAERRRNEINEYLGGLIGMPAEVIECSIVQKLFGSRADSSLIHQHSPDRNTRQALQVSCHAKHTPSLSAASTADSTSTPASASSTDTAVDGHHCIVDAAPYASMQNPKTLSCDSKVTARADYQAQQRLAHKSSAAALGGQGAMVKVKVKLGSDMVALRLPSELTLSELKSRIAAKLGNGSAADPTSSISQIIYTAPSGESASLSDDRDWENALLATNYKPVLTIVQ
ncbi:bud emergence protein 1 [Coemansia sp. RSA 552]|nr:bud emergence protein 1 [Coemansia sp. RSA 552]